jgi:hypothetical protein
MRQELRVYHMAEVELVGTERADPGVSVAALLVPGDLPFWSGLRTGQIITICEGKKVVGEAVIHKPLSDNRSS